jgi:hypothetical protein
MIFAQISLQEFNVSYCQVWDLGGVAEQYYKHLKLKVSERYSILLWRSWYDRREYLYNLWDQVKLNVKVSLPYPLLRKTFRAGTPPPAAGHLHLPASPPAWTPRRGRQAARTKKRIRSLKDEIIPCLFPRLPDSCTFPDDSPSNLCAKSNGRWLRHLIGTRRAPASENHDLRTHSSIRPRHIPKDWRTARQFRRYDIITAPRPDIQECQRCTKCTATGFTPHLIPLLQIRSYLFCINTAYWTINKLVSTPA